MMSYLALAQQAIQVLHHLPSVAGALGEGLTSHAIWEWMKKHLHKPEQRQALEKTARQPEEELNWQLLQAYLAEALKEDDALQHELAALLQQHGGTHQEVHNTGDGNKTAQTVGNNNSVTIH